jgi:hypothetical protein
VITNTPCAEPVQDEHDHGGVLITKVLCPETEFLKIGATDDPFSTTKEAELHIQMVL